MPRVGDHACSSRRGSAVLQYSTKSAQRNASLKTSLAALTLCAPYTSLSPTQSVPQVTTQCDAGRTNQSRQRTSVGLAEVEYWNACAVRSGVAHAIGRALEDPAARCP